MEIAIKRASRAENWVAMKAEHKIAILIKHSIFPVTISAMPDIGQEKLSELLKLAKEAHVQFEKVELNGQYDEQWAAWYADYLVTNGLQALIGRELDMDRLTNQLSEIIQRHKAERTAENWADYTARELLHILT